MNYQNFEASFMRENRILKIGLTASLVLLVTLLLITRSQGAYFIYQGGEIFKENLLLVDICKEGFESLTKKSPHPYFVTDGIIKTLKREPFELGDYEISFLKSTDQNHCRLIVKTELSSRSFLIELKEDKEFPFAFKVSGIKESEIAREEI